MTNDQAFQKWWMAPGPSFTDEEDIAQQAWQASRQQMAEEAAALADRQKEIGDRNEDHSWEICAAQLAYAIRSLATPSPILPSEKEVFRALATPTEGKT